MEKFTQLTGVAAPLNLINVDTDMIIPKQYLKTIARSGLGKALFSEMRYLDDGSDNPDFVLNQPAYKNASVLVTGENFGCGSSREHAPWALLDFGIRCVIAPSFADIFYNNCFKNGILPIKLPQEDVDRLMDDAERGANARLTVDLESQEITGPDGGTITFDIDPHLKHCLLNGLDDVGLTMQKQDKIATYEEKHAAERPWV
ncbi:MAG: 3-isopropylmalate dehydratase small subunit [Hyphomicrobiales bacterium]|nr:3-isopropylmalate dehydratase small subunit [Hyphomicrobiales bacterium]